MSKKLRCVIVIRNGETNGKAVFLSPAESWRQFILLATGKLNISANGVRVFHATGGELLCVDEVFHNDILYFLEKGDSYVSVSRLMVGDTESEIAPSVLEGYLYELTTSEDDNRDEGSFKARDWSQRFYTLADGVLSCFMHGLDEKPSRSVSVSDILAVYKLDQEIAATSGVYPDPNGLVLHVRRRAKDESHDNSTGNAKTGSCRSQSPARGSNDSENGRDSSDSANDPILRVHLVTTSRQRMGVWGHSIQQDRLRLNKVGENEKRRQKQLELEGSSSQLLAIGQFQRDLEAHIKQLRDQLDEARRAEMVALLVSLTGCSPPLSDSGSILPMPMVRPHRTASSPVPVSLMKKRRLSTVDNKDEGRPNQPSALQLNLQAIVNAKPPTPRMTRSPTLSPRNRSGTSTLVNTGTQLRKNSMSPRDQSSAPAQLRKNSMSPREGAVSPTSPHLRPQSPMTRGRSDSRAAPLPPLSLCSRQPTDLTTLTQLCGRRLESREFALKTCNLIIKSLMSRVERGENDLSAPVRTNENRSMSWTRLGGPSPPPQNRQSPPSQQSTCTYRYATMPVRSSSSSSSSSSSTAAAAVASPKRHSGRFDGVKQIFKRGLSFSVSEASTINREVSPSPSSSLGGDRRTSGHSKNNSKSPPTSPIISPRNSFEKKSSADNVPTDARGGNGSGNAPFPGINLHHVSPCTSPSTSPRESPDTTPPTSPTPVSPTPVSPHQGSPPPVPKMRPISHLPRYSTKARAHSVASRSPRVASTPTLNDRGHSSAQRPNSPPLADVNSPRSPPLQDVSSPLLAHLKTPPRKGTTGSLHPYRRGPVIDAIVHNPAPIHSEPAAEQKPHKPPRPPRPAANTFAN
eukprot:TRINITY_DN4913_c0_g1_i1.p1 TRINITY_DN4913_c0_g1~~TRINITY_DN4913_c0_g1_i1.p1  ORF type:complete len:856 (+),score=148.91 TRINITY_DN4913_c0_g1_i1:219-2786(+)